MNRRDLLATYLKTTGAVVMGVITIPLVIDSFSPVLKASAEAKEDWRRLGPVENFPLNQIVPFEVSVQDERSAGSLAFKGVFVWRQDQENFVVYSRACTDLGCPLSYDKGSRWFFCPCHGGIFNTEGERQAGPPKKPMWRYATRIQKGYLEIDLKSVPPMV